MITGIAVNNARYFILDRKKTTDYTDFTDF